MESVHFEMIYVAVAGAFFSLSRKLFSLLSSRCEKRNINVALNIRFLAHICDLPDPNFSTLLLSKLLPVYLFVSSFGVLQKAEINFE